MKHLKTFENHKEESINEAVVEMIAIANALIYGYAILAPMLDKKDNAISGTDKESTFKKVIQMVKTKTQKVIDSLKGVVSDMKSLGLEDEAQKWLNANFVDNPEFKSMDEQISRIQSEISEIEERKSKSTSDIKRQQLDTLISNKNKQLNDITNNRSIKGKTLFENLQKENLPLYKALSRVWDKMHIMKRMEITPKLKGDSDLTK